MSRKKNNDGFDCVEFKRQAQSKIYEETKGMSTHEQIAYFHKRAASGSIGRWWKTLPSVPLNFGSQRVAESKTQYGRKKR